MAKNNKKKNSTRTEAKSSPHHPSSTSSSQPTELLSLCCDDNGGRGSGGSSGKQRSICPRTIKGTDDTGRFYSCHDELLMFQATYRDELYRANSLWWAEGGYNGSNDDEAMIGDSGGEADGEEGLTFLDRYLSLIANNNSNHNINEVSSLADEHQPRRSQQNRCCFQRAVDLGAGVGRVTKLILLKRYAEVRLVEGDENWSKRSRVYLGRKRASRCTFIHQRLDDLTSADVQGWGEPADLMWVQWTFQYLIDADVVECLRVVSSGLREGSGVLIVKENRPFGGQREDRFQMDVPAGANQRYDITRSDSHHRLLFQQAGLTVTFTECGVETNTYVLIK